MAQHARGCNSDIIVTPQLYPPIVKRCGPLMALTSLTASTLPGYFNQQSKKRRESLRERKATTPEPPPRSAAVRRFDETLGGLCSLSTSNQPSRNEIINVATTPGAASADREGCFSKSMLPLFCFLYLTLFFLIHYF